MAVCVLTQLTKGIKFIERIPTQIWSYILSLIVLLLAQVFGDGFNAQNAVLAVFNAMRALSVSRVAGVGVVKE